MWGTVVFATLFAVLCARLFGARRRQIFEKARLLPLAPDDIERSEVDRGRE